MLDVATLNGKKQAEPQSLANRWSCSRVNRHSDHTNTSAQLPHKLQLNDVKVGPREGANSLGEPRLHKIIHAHVPMQVFILESQSLHKIGFKAAKRFRVWMVEFKTCA